MQTWISVVALVLLAGCKPAPQGPVPLQLNVVTTPPGATVTTSGVRLGQTPVKVAIPPGPRILEVELAGYETAWLKVPADAVTTCSLEARLLPERAAVLVESEPAGASLRLNGEDKGKTPLLLSQLPLGTYAAELAAPGCAPRSFRIVVDNPRPRRVRQQLDSVIGSLEVWTTPGGVDVFLGEKLAGTTPEEGEPVLLFKDLPAGNCNITARRTGFRPLSLSAVIKPKQREIVKFSAMQALPGALVIESEPTGAEVLNSEGRLLGVTPLSLKDVALGLLAFKLRKEGYAEEIKSIEVLPGATQTLAVTLRKVTGSLEVMTEPPGVNVLLDGQIVGKTAVGDNPKVSKLFTREGLAPGTHLLELQHPDYEPLTLKFKIELGQATSLGPQVLKKRWQPTHRLKLVNGTIYDGILINQNKDGSIIFENAPRSRGGYMKEEIDAVIPLTPAMRR